MRKPVILIGYMGAGKTTVGRLLSQQYGMAFFDTDTMIEEQEKRSISDIFAKDGEERFRDMETELLKRLKREGLSGAVLSVGGGLPLREENRRLLKELGTVFYLMAEKETIVERVSGSDDRPLLQGGELLAKVENMLAVRGPFYEQAADRRIATDGRTASEICAEIGETV